MMKQVAIFTQTTFIAGKLPKLLSTLLLTVISSLLTALQLPEAARQIVFGGILLVLMALPGHPGVFAALPLGIWILTILLNPENRKTFVESR